MLHLQQMVLYTIMKILLSNDDEIKSFNIFNDLIKNPKYSLGGLYVKEFPRLFLAIYQVNKLSQKYIRNVYNHLKKFNLKKLK